MTKEFDAWREMMKNAIPASMHKCEGCLFAGAEYIDKSGRWWHKGCHGKPELLIHQWLIDCEKDIADKGGEE